MNKLNVIPDSNPFKVPENYFEEAGRRIISATSGSDRRKEKEGLLRRLKPYFSIAASIAAIIIISLASIRFFVSENRNKKLPEISMEEFTETYLYDIDLLTLEEQVVSGISSEDLPDLNTSEIIDYLLLMNIDVNEIYEFL